MNQPARTFKDMLAWQKAYSLSLIVYEVAKKLPKDEQYGLSSQMKRSSVSVASNIAEGFGRRSLKEKDQFYAIAKGSLTELENQLLIAKGVGYLTDADFDVVEDHCLNAHKVLAGLQRANKLKGESAAILKSRI